MPSTWDPGLKKNKKTNKKKNKTKTTLAKLALYASGFVVDTSSTIPPFFERELQHNNYTDLTGRLNVTTAVALANTQRPPARHVSSIIPSHQLHTALIFDKQNCISLLMYIGCLSFSFFFCFKRKDKCVKLCGNPEMSLLFFVFFFLQTLTSLLYFFLTREIKLVILYCHDNDDHLFTRCTRCPPACLCVHERSVDSMTEWRRK